MTTIILLFLVTYAVTEWLSHVRRSSTTTTTQDESVLWWWPILTVNLTEQQDKMRLLSVDYIAPF